jgi:hypothetical protein
MPAMDNNGGMGSAMADDLPRTLRREREARERSAQGLNHQPAGLGSARPTGSASYVPEPAMADGIVLSGTTVTDIQVPFVQLMMFCFKLVFAAVPALIAFFVLLWLAGHALMTYFPWLVKVQILLRVPN